MVNGEEKLDLLEVEILQLKSEIAIDMASDRWSLLCTCSKIEQSCGTDRVAG